MSKDRIAIIGIGCRFPGGINHPDALWKLLVEGREAVGEVPPDRWNVERFYDAEPGIAGKSIARRGGFVDGIDQFDPQFFGISPREAPYVDPQHRLLLETAWEAIEDAGLVLDFEKGTDIGVFVGISHNDYQVIQGTPWDSQGISPHSPTGSAHSIAANRISYCLNLRGPSVAMDTACSSALTAVHAACEHIRAGRGDTALAGGVTVMITPGGFIGFSQASMLSPDGKCKAFDASANGFVRGEGAGMVLLKRLSQAIADGDPIHGVIIGTALNQDGHTNGISLPSAEAQARLVRDACMDAGIAPSRIGFVEAHGTGTAVGDPIEAHALADALCAGPPGRIPAAHRLGEDEPWPSGNRRRRRRSGESGARAQARADSRQPPFCNAQSEHRLQGIEAARELHARTIPGDRRHAHGGRELVRLRRRQRAHHYRGSRRHVRTTEHSETPTERAWPIVLSARSEDALRGSALHLAQWLDERSHANGDSPLLPDLVYSLGARRNHHPYRLTIVTNSMTELVQELDGFGVKQESPKVRTAFTPRREAPPRIAFVMSGQGPQWYGMGRELMRHEPVFRADPRTLRRRDETVGALFPARGTRSHRGDLADATHRDRAAGDFRHAGLAGGAVEIVGHRIPRRLSGTASERSPRLASPACFSLEEAARIIVLRARFMDGCARGEGTMLALGLGEDEARALIARHDRTVTIAAINGPRSLTLAGARISLEAMLAELEPQGVFARLVRVDHPFHHPLMQPASEALEKALADLEPQAEHGPVFQHRHRRALPWRNVQRRPLGTRRAAARAVCVGGQCAGGIRRGCVAGNQRASRAGSLRSGMSRGSQ